GSHSGRWFAAGSHLRLERLLIDGRALGFACLGAISAAAAAAFAAFALMPQVLVMRSLYDWGRAGRCRFRSRCALRLWLATRLLALMLLVARCGAFNARLAAGRAFALTLSSAQLTAAVATRRRIGPRVALLAVLGARAHGSLRYFRLDLGPATLEPAENFSDD